MIDLKCETVHITSNYDTTFDTNLKYSDFKRIIAIFQTLVGLTVVYRSYQYTIKNGICT